MKRLSNTNYLGRNFFDNHALGSHRAMAAVLSSILKLPPVKRAMASKQMKSIYLEKVIEKLGI